MTNLARGFAKLGLVEDLLGLSLPACDALTSLDDKRA